jgi:hypothetical protein
MVGTDRTTLSPLGIEAKLSGVLIGAGKQSHSKNQR